ncbi:MAG: DUF5360 family protein [Gammaproteobacteria bacterium]
MKGLKYYFLLVDIGFIAYWGITLSGAIPDALLFKDYADPIMVAWDWSFLPLDLLISVTGLTSLFLWNTGSSNWSPFASVSLSLTSCSALQAIAFWTIRQDFDLSWWLPNLFLLIYPLSYIKAVANHPVISSRS